MPLNEPITHRLPGQSLVTIGRLAAAIAIAGITLRAVSVTNQTLWADELFSIAMATGHSLEHSAAEASLPRGDWVEMPSPQTPAFYRTYLEHAASGTPWRRVLRAVSLSDTSPPLYYLVLNLWSTLFGTSDIAIRMLSIACAALCFPLLWEVGRSLGGDVCGLLACAMFAVSPVGVYFSVEARMYALTWVFALAILWASIRLDERPASMRWAVVWVFASAGGLLTHYFFAFIWTAAVLWLTLRRSVPALRLAGALLLTTAAVAPWYVSALSGLSRWRVTGDWLLGYPDQGALRGAPYKLLSGLASIDWAGYTKFSYFAAVVACTLAVGALSVGVVRGQLTRHHALVALSLFAAISGLFAVDWLRSTHTVTVPRYALVGLPAMLLLISAGLTRLPPLVRVPVAAAMVVSLAPIAWLYAAGHSVETTGRNWASFPALAQRLAAADPPLDLVIVHSIPSGVVGVARYMTHGPDLLSWVQQLGVRQIDDLPRLTASRRRVAIVQVQTLGAAAPEIDWLHAHSRFAGEELVGAIQVLFFDLDVAQSSAGRPARMPPASPLRE